MSKRVFWFATILLLLSVVIWYFAAELSVWAQELWGLKDDTREKISFWLDTVTKIFGVIVATAMGVWRFLRPASQSAIQPLISGAEAAPLPPSSDINLEQLYYQNLDSSCELLKLNLIEKNMGQRQGGRLSLSEIYQDQLIRLPENKQGKREQLEQGADFFGRQDAEPLMSALEKLDSRRLVLLGKLGSGKSSFVNFLAHSVIRSQYEAVEGLPAFLSNRPVIRVLLREVGLNLDEKSTTDGLIWREARRTVRQHINSELARDEKPPVAESLFSPFWESYKRDFIQKQGVLLLDGLDEVSRADALALLREGLLSFANHKEHVGVLIIVTSRPPAYATPEQKLSGFVQSELEPMNMEQIKAFIGQWYQLIERADLQVAEQKSEDLATEIFDNPALKDRKDLQEMAERPLLLTLLVGLHSAGKSLNRSRPEVYKEIIELLLQRWQVNLKDTLDSLREELKEGMKVLQQSPNELMAGLQQLAFQTYESLDDGDVKNKERLEFHATDAVGTLYGNKCEGADLNHVLDFLEDRSTLLLSGNEEGKLQFAHKSFHEYLAACHLLNEADWQQQITGLLRGKPQWWREVFLFMAKDEADGRFGSAVSFLNDVVLEDYARDRVCELRLLLLAAEAAVEMGLPKQLNNKRTHIELFELLQKELIFMLNCSLVSLVERAEAGRLLGELGDTRPGIGVIREGEFAGLPDIDWASLAAFEFPIKTEEEQDKTPVPVKPFRISCSPVTNAQFSCFISAGGYKEKRYWQRSAVSLEWWQKNQPEQPAFWSRRQWNNPNHPVVGVTWHEALAFCEWLKSTSMYMGHEVRLPTDVEWEYAASGTKGLVYPWGEEKPVPERANYDETGLGQASAIGLFPFGKAVDSADRPIELYDMAGNVWEWTTGLWGKNISKQAYPYAKWTIEQEKQRNKLDSNEWRIIRGGSWFVTSVACRCAVRYGLHPDFRNDLIGFRLVLS